jgi:predicted metal-dependent phosphoesterase TrpH
MEGWVERGSDEAYADLRQWRKERAGDIRQQSEAIIVGLPWTGGIGKAEEPKET